MQPIIPRGIFHQLATFCNNSIKVYYILRHSITTTWYFVYLKFSLPVCTVEYTVTQDDCTKYFAKMTTTYFSHWDFHRQNCSPKFKLSKFMLHLKVLVNRLYGWFCLWEWTVMTTTNNTFPCWTTEWSDIKLKWELTVILVSAVNYSYHLGKKEAERK